MKADPDTFREKNRLATQKQSLKQMEKDPGEKSVTQAEAAFEAIGKQQQQQQHGSFRRAGGEKLLLLRLDF